MSEEAFEARDEAMARVEFAAKLAERQAVGRAIEAVAKAQAYLQADDVMSLLESWERVPREPRLLGPLMKKAVGAGILQPTGQFQYGYRRKNHGRHQAVYQSRLYRG